MRKLLASLLLTVPLIAYAGTYLVPPDIDDIRQSTKGSTLVVISHGTADTHKTYNVNIGGTVQPISYDCVTLPKINCQMGTTTIFTSTSSLQAMEKITSSDTSYVTATPTTIDIKVSDNGDSFLICAMIGTSRGNALLTNRDTPDSSGNPASTYDSNNPSFLIVSTKQECK